MTVQPAAASEADIYPPQDMTRRSSYPPQASLFAHCYTPRHNNIVCHPVQIMPPTSANANGRRHSHRGDNDVGDNDAIARVDKNIVCAELSPSEMNSNYLVQMQNVAIALHFDIKKTNYVI